MEVGLRETLTTDVAAGVTVSVALELPLSVAVIEEVACETTERLVTVKFAVVDPAKTVTGLTTVATAVLLLASATWIPPVGAGPFRVTVPVELAEPPVTDVGLRDTDATAAGLIVSCAVAVPLKVAVIVGVVTVATEVVATVKLAVEEAANTVTVPGTVAAALLLDSVTVAPPAGAGPFRWIVPTDDEEPITLAGFKETDVTANVNGLTVSVVVFVTSPMAEIVTGVTAPTVLVFAINVTEVNPSGIVTLPGTVTAGLLLESDIIQSPMGAGPVNVTVPEEEYPALTVDGFRVTEAGDGGFTVTVPDWIPLPVAVIVAAVEKIIG